MGHPLLFNFELKTATTSAVVFKEASIKTWPGDFSPYFLMEEHFPLPSLVFSVLSREYKLNLLLTWPLLGQHTYLALPFLRTLSRGKVTLFNCKNMLSRMFFYILKLYLVNFKSFLSDSVIFSPEPISSLVVLSYKSLCNTALTIRPGC